jgi:membrane-associated protease RseP (regulator of RpoE activity)
MGEANLVRNPGRPPIFLAKEDVMYKRFLTAAAAGALLLVALPALAQSQDSENATNTHGAFLGIQAESAPQNAQHEGAIVRKVEPNSPASKAGLKRGDIITKMANQNITDFEELDSVLTEHKPGQKMPVTVLRNGQTKHLTVTLGKRTGQQFSEGGESGQFGANENEQYQGNQQYRRNQSGQNQEEQGAQGYYSRGRQGAFLGVETEELTPSVRRREGISAQQGCVVAEVVPNSPAEQAGLQEGDVITKVDGQAVSDPQELRDAIQSAGAGQEVTLDVTRGRRHHELTAQLQRYSGQFGAESGQFYGMSPTQQSREIQRLQQRIQQLERRIRSLEQNWQNQPSR